jgi:hypothetical protein
MAASPETVRSTLELPRALALNVLELRCPGVHELTRLSRPESRDARIDLRQRPLFGTRATSWCPKCVRLRHASVVTDNKDPRYAGLFLKPSDGLEPSTPSLPWRCSTS